MLRSISRSGVRLSFVVVVGYAAIIAAIAGFRWSDLIILTKYLLSVVPVWIALVFAILIATNVRRMNKGAEGAHPLDLLKNAPWRTFLWPPLLYTFLLGLFGIFKQRVLVNAAFTFDRTFSDWDRAIFGVDPWRLSHPSPLLTEWLGAIYYGWYAPMMLGILACAFIAGRSQLRDRYVLTFVLTWIIVGSLMPYLMPAAGPCYWDQFVGGHNPYSELLKQLRYDVSISTTYNPVLDAQEYLLRAYGSTTVLGGGISAMPSMHIALATVFACCAWRIHRALGALFCIFTAAIWWASVHLGWHYFVDGLVAIPSSLAIWWTVGLLYPEVRVNRSPAQIAKIAIGTT